MAKKLHVFNVLIVIEWYTGTICCTFKYLYIFVVLKYTGLVFFWCACLFLYALIYGEKNPRLSTTSHVILGPLFTRTASAMGRRASPAVCRWRGGRTAAQPDGSTHPCVFVRPLAFEA